ncbi:hypothetical protein ACFQ7B_21130 [Streptomyces erythrochromogenes]
MTEYHPIDLLAECGAAVLSRNRRRDMITGFGSSFLPPRGRFALFHVAFQ